MDKKIPPNITKDRRKHPRVQKTIGVTLCPVDYLFRGDFLSKDISEGGICLLTSEKMEIGTTVELGLHIPQLEETVKMIGEVVRRAETNDLKYPYLLGIKFTSIDEKAHKQISNYLRFYRHDED